MQSDVFRGSSWVSGTGIIVIAWQGMVLSLRCFVGEVFVLDFIEFGAVQVRICAANVELSQRNIIGRHRNPKVRH